MTEKKSTVFAIPDEDLLSEGRAVVGTYLTRALDELGEGVAWSTLDLRIFRDVDEDTLNRHTHLTLRASALRFDR